MKRRDLIMLLGSAAAWPIAARAQQTERVRRIGLLFHGSEIDRNEQAGIGVFRESLARLGWVDGRNLRIDLRWGFDDAERIRAQAKELVGLAPEVIVTNGGAATRAARQATQTIPIVVTGGADPAATGLIRDIARPEGNITGFPAVEASVINKRLAVLKEIAPHVRRIAALFNPDLLTAGPAYFSLLEASAPALDVQLVEIPFRTALEIVRAIDAFAAKPNGAILIMPPPPTGSNFDIMTQLAAQHRLPLSCVNRPHVLAGGLVSYGQVSADNFRGAAAYVDRLLRGAKVADLPVQFGTKFELVINLKAAKAIGLVIPESILLHADEVIE
jgi:putative ABC transport system substrate-binding protein